MPYFPYIPYRSISLSGDLGGQYTPVPFEVPFSSQASPGDKYQQAEISVPAQVTAAPSSNISPVTPAAAQLHGAFQQQSWTVGPYGLGDGISTADIGTMLSDNVGLILAGLGAAYWLARKKRR